MTEEIGVEPSEIEKSDLDGDSTIPRGLFVGMVPRKAFETGSVGFGAGEDGGSRDKGKSIVENNDPIVIPYDKHALRVIVLEGAKTCKFYALTTPENGLCTPRSVTNKEVYLFKNWRDEGDSIPQVAGRTKVWTDKIRAIIRPQDKGKAVAKPSLVSKVPWQHQLVNEAELLTLEFEKTRDIRYLKQLEELLEERVKYVETNPGNSNRMVHKLFTSKPEVRLSHAEAQLALSEITVRFRLPQSFELFVDRSS